MFAKKQNKTQTFSHDTHEFDKLIAFMFQEEM